MTTAKTEIIRIGEIRMVDNREKIKIVLVPTRPVENCKSDCWQCEIDAGKKGIMTYWHRDKDRIIKEVADHLKRVM